jgi:hypothetical protein
VALLIDTDVLVDPETGSLLGDEERAISVITARVHAQLWAELANRGQVIGAFPAFE